jgi:hypothetical protein
MPFHQPSEFHPGVYMRPSSTRQPSMLSGNGKRNRVLRSSRFQNTLSSAMQCHSSCPSTASRVVVLNVMLSKENKKKGGKKELLMKNSLLSSVSHLSTGMGTAPKDPLQATTNALACFGLVVFIASQKTKAHPPSHAPGIVA